jgi:hypothetical protein
MLNLAGLVVATSMLVGQTPKVPLSPHYEHLKIYEDLIGTAVTEGHEGDIRWKGESTHKWAEGKQCVYLTETYEVRNDADGTVRVWNITGVEGWDPESQRIKSLFFSSNGDYATTYYTVKGNQLLGERTSVKADGSKSSLQLTITIHGPRKWTWQSKGRVDDAGEPRDITVELVPK